MVCVGRLRMIDWDFATLLFLVLAIPVLSGVIAHFTRDQKLDDKLRRLVKADQVALLAIATLFVAIFVLVLIISLQP
jgi:hypothetical protein